jgi:hypothetical protein
MKRQKKSSNGKLKPHASAGNERLARRGRDEEKKRLLALEKRVRELESWQKRLRPQFPDIDPHDLHLIIESLLRTRKERMEVMLLKRRKDGFYVF